MPTIIEMPKLSDTMSVGTVVKWHKSIGDTVANGDTLAEIETDKATMELENFDDGTLLKILVEEGDEAPIGSPLAVIGSEGDSLDELDLKLPSSNTPSNNEDSAVVDSADNLEEVTHTELRDEPDAAGASIQENKSDKGDNRVLISPLAKKMAKESNLDISLISGTGPSGRIIKKDILNLTGLRERATNSSQAVLEDLPVSSSATNLHTKGLLESNSVKISGMRSIIAKRLTESKQTIPHFYLSKEIDAVPLKVSREAINASIAEKSSLSNDSGARKLSINDFILKACAETLRWHPAINSSWGEDKIIMHPNVHLSFGVAVEGGLLTPVIKNACGMSLIQISEQAKGLIDKARNKKLSPDEMVDSTFTVTNLGMFGIDSFSGIVNPPNAAILSVGSSSPKPVIDKRSGLVVPGETITLGLSCDHRLVDGALAADFLKMLATHLENPSTFLI